VAVRGEGSWPEVTVSWLRQAERLAGVATGWEGLWSVLVTARRAALALAMLPGLDDDLTFTEGALDLREAVEELEWLHPGLPLRAVSVDLGDAPLDQVNACRTAVGGLLTAVLAEARRLNRLPGELDTPQVLALARVSQLAASAHRRVTGRLR
jgi:hypothetical protein